MRRASSGRSGGLPRGARHPVTVMAEQMTDVLLDLGYRVTEGPEVEAEWFTLVSADALGPPGVADLLTTTDPPGPPVPADRPVLPGGPDDPDGPDGRRPGRVLRVRDPTDPDGHRRGSGLVLRSHSASLRVRAMLATPPPLRAVCAGRLFRPEAAGTVHGPVFHEVGGVAVDLGLTAVDLGKTLDHFAASVFGAGTAIRLRPRRPVRAGPPAETDVEVECPACHGTAPCEDSPAGTYDGTGAGPCGTCGGTGWARWGRCGPVHHRVLAACGVDPHRYGAFAFGLGVERTLMLRHGLRDVRDLVDGDVRPLLRMDGLRADDPPPSGTPRHRPRPRSAPGVRTTPGPRATPVPAAVPAARAVPEMETIPLTRGGLGARGAPGRGARDGLPRSRSLERRIGHALADAGYVETPRLPFVCDAAWEAFDLAPGDPRRAAPVLANPIDPRERSLRTTLLPGLLAALALNLTRGNRDPALFEQGTVFTSLPGTGPPPVPPTGRRPTDDQLAALDAAVPAQPRHLAVALTGESSWARAVDAARTAAHVMGAGLVTRPAAYAPWLTGRCLELLADGTVLGHAGELRAGTVRALGLPPGTSAMELDLTAMERLTDGRCG
ncbi:hypothetical protein ACIBCT_29135 [Streptosporangium sp. NPDC050855]|uniref:tRNA ligase subunit PheS family protein n=1 Tax=Streptosporangium sp. NPDC050855 TaxID=3366194 RepID=UPI00379D85A2